MSKPYYYWDPIGRDPEHPDKPEFVQLRARDKGKEESCIRMGHYVASYPEDDLAAVTLFYMLDNRIRFFGALDESRWTFRRRDVIAGVFGLAMAKRMKDVRELRFPWWLSLSQRTSPSLRAWIRFMQTGSAKHARKFHLLTLLRYFVLNKLRMSAMEDRYFTSLQLFLCPSKDCSAAVMEDVNPENLHLQILNDHDQKRILLCKPDEYVASMGWPPRDPLYLTKLFPIGSDDEAIKLDKDFLIRIATIWKEKKLKENPMNLLKAMFGNGSGRDIRN